MPPGANIRNAIRRLLMFDRFNGGISTSKKSGRRGSFRFAFGCDIYSEPTQITGLPRTVKDSGTTVTGKIVDGVRVFNGDTYWLDSDKKFYKRTAAGVWSVIATLAAGTNGMGLHFWPQKDTIFLTTDNEVSTYGPISGTPVLSDGKYGQFIDQVASVSASAYPQNGNIQGHWSMDDTTPTITYPQSGSIQGHWLMNEASGTRADTSGNGNTLADNNTVLASDTSFKEGTRSADFERSTSEYLSITDGAQTGLDFTGDMSFFGWFKVETAPSDSILDLVIKNAGADRAYAILYRDTAGTKFVEIELSDTAASGGVVTKTVNLTLTVDTWVHFGFVYDASEGEGRVYIDGAQVGATLTGFPTSINNSTAPFELGGSTNTFDGLMDDVTMWDAALTDAEVLAFYESYVNNRTDSSGNSNTLLEADTPVGVDTSNQAEGTGAADFETTLSNLLEIVDGDQTGLDVTGAMTIAFHVRPETVAANMDCVAKWDSGGNDRAYRVQLLSNGKIQFDVSVDGTVETTVDSNAVTLSAGTTYHVACVFTPSQKMEIFIDAVAANDNTTSIPASINNSSAPFRVGADENGASVLDGLIDDLVVWNTMLTTANIVVVKNVPGNYVPLTSVTETSNDQFFFTPENDPVVSIILNVSDKGSGDWTVTIHDDDDNVVATSTVTNGNLTNGANNTFAFEPDFRPMLGAQYHGHITSTVADGAVTTGNSFTSKSATLVSPRSDAHPMLDFTTFLAFCNANYITTFDGLLTAPLTDTGKLTSSWDVQRVKIPTGYEMACVTSHKEFMVFGCEYRGDNVDDFTAGLIVFWDGLSANANFFVEVQEGGVQSIDSQGGNLIFGAGLRGEVFEYDLGRDRYKKLFRLPKTTDTTYVRTSWGSITNYLGLTILGYPFVTNNAAFNNGAYAWGHKEEGVPEVLNYSWYPSHGERTGVTREIGCVKAWGTDLFIAWKEGSTYGVDIVEPGNKAYAEWGMEGRVEDIGKPWHEKYVRVVRADHKALDGVDDSVQVGVDIDQSGTFATGDANTTANSVKTRKVIDKKFKTIEWTVIAKNEARIDSITLDIEPREESELV